MKSRIILLISATLAAVSCGPLVQQPQGSPRFADAVYTVPKAPTRTVSIYSQDDFRKLAANQPKMMPDTLDLESNGTSVTYEWRNPYFWYSPHYYGGPYSMYAFGGPMSWRMRSYMGSFWYPYSDWAYSYYWDWYTPYGYYGMYNTPWYYDPWYFDGRYLWEHQYWHHYYPYYGGGSHYHPGNSIAGREDRYYGPRSLVQGGGRSDSGTRLPGGKPGYTGSTVTRSGMSAVGTTPRSEARTSAGAAGTYQRSGSVVTTERGYAPNSTGNYSRGGSSSSGSSVSRSGSTYRSSESSSYSRSSESTGFSRSSGGYSGGSSGGGYSGGGSSRSSSSTGGGGGGRR